MAELDRQDIEQKIIDIVSKKLSIDDTQIVAKSKSFEDLGADSLDMVEIIMKLEEQFGIEIDDEAAEKISGLQQAIDYIQSLKKK